MVGDESVRDNPARAAPIDDSKVTLRRLTKTNARRDAGRRRYQSICRLAAGTVAQWWAQPAVPNRLGPASCVP
jgi:hypothetical protein